MGLRDALFNEEKNLVTSAGFLSTRLIAGLVVHLHLKLGVLLERAKVLYARVPTF